MKQRRRSPTALLEESPSGAGAPKSESDLQLFLDTIPTQVWRASADGALEYFNRRWLDYTGLNYEQAKGWRWTAAVHPDDRVHLLETWQTMLRGGDAGDVEARLRSANGRYRWFLFRCVPLRDGTGRVGGWCGTNIDIEGRKRTEADLLSSNEMLGETQRLAKCGSIGFDVAAEKVFWSAEGARIFGFEPDDDPPSLERLWERIHPDDRWLPKRSVERARRGEPDTEYDVRLVMPDGSLRYVRKINPPAGSRSSAGSVCALLEVTETREAEAALHKAQSALAHVTRVTSLGELSASIAHEIIQPIAAIATTGEASLRWLLRAEPDIGEARQGLRDMIAQARRAAEIVDRIRALARKSRSEQLLFDLNAMLNEVLVLIQGEFVHREVSLRLELEEGLPAVRGDRVQLQQVIINLVVNGLQAMARHALSARVLSLRSRRHGNDQVVIEVEDAGGGIDPAIGDKMFEPFATTKPQGLGMGLAICRSIVAGHNGRLWFTPTVGGTIFHVALPVG